MKSSLSSPFGLWRMVFPDCVGIRKTVRAVSRMLDGRVGGRCGGRPRYPYDLEVALVTPTTLKEPESLSMANTAYQPPPNNDFGGPSEKGCSLPRQSKTQPFLLKRIIIPFKSKHPAAVNWLDSTVPSLSKQSSEHTLPSPKFAIHQVNCYPCACCLPDSHPFRVRCA